MLGPIKSGMQKSFVPGQGHINVGIKEAGPPDVGQTGCRGGRTSTWVLDVLNLLPPQGRNPAKG